MTRQHARRNNENTELNLLSHREMTSIQGEYSEFEVTKTSVQNLFESDNNTPKPQFPSCIITL